MFPIPYMMQHVWDGNLEVPTKNAIRDKIESLAPSHDSVTMSGTPDYITLSGQDIVRGQVDLSTDVTGTLADGNIASTIARENNTWLLDESQAITATTYNVIGPTTFRLGTSASRIPQLELWAGTNPLALNSQFSTTITTGSTFVVDATGQISIDSDDDINITPGSGDFLVINNIADDNTATRMLALTDTDSVVVVDNLTSETPAPTAVKFDKNYLNTGTYTQSGAVAFNTSGTIVPGNYYSFLFDGDNSGAITFNTSTESWRLIGVTDGGTLDGVHSVLITAISSTIFEAVFVPLTDTAP